MRKITAVTIAEVISDLENELHRLERLENQVKAVQAERLKHPNLEPMLAESSALKLHNFYTGCERIFQIIASELNGGKPSSYDWHRRLLERMSACQDYRPAVISQETAQKLQDYLGFRHIVRNIYGFELNLDRLEELIKSYFKVNQEFLADIRQFIEWLQTVQNELANEYPEDLPSQSLLNPK